MGLVYADLQLISGGDLVLQRRGYISSEQIKSVTVHALVDSGCSMLAINETIQAQLDLPQIEQQSAEMADGSTIILPIVGPVEVRFQNRSTTCRAIVLPNNAEVLLGVIPLEDMDVMIAPKNQQLIVNPQSPNMARKYLK